MVCDEDSKGAMLGLVGPGRPQEVIRMLSFGTGHRAEYSSIKVLAVNSNF